MSELNKTCNCEACEYRLLVFACLSSQEVNSLCDFKHERQYSKGEIIVKEGDLIKEFFYLKTGLVKNYRRVSSSKDQIVNIASPMDFVSLLSVFSETHYKYSITALDDTTVCCIDFSVIKELVRKNGEFALGLMERMSKNADKIILQNLCLNMKNLRGRIAYIILLFSNEIYNSDKFDLPVSRKEIAQLIDMTTENVIRILSEFKKDNIIIIEGKNIEIINKDVLRIIAQHG